MNPQRLQCVPSTTSPERQRPAKETRRWRSGLVILLSAVALALPSAAQAQGDLNKPYKLHIVVHVSHNRLLTDVFRDGIERELRDGFQAALGDMGHVEVSHKHPRLAEVLTQGLQALNSWNDRSDVKTHFVLIDFSGVHYEIQAKQYDGTTGRASPVVRRDRTRDRDFVAKAAALLIKQDFGILGTVVSPPEGKPEEVKVELRGGGLGDLSRWVRKDEVFALVPPGGYQPALTWSLLQVQKAPDENAREGLCVCRFFHRYKVPDITGYRCIKLGTVQTPLRLRWMQEMPQGGLKPLADNTTLTVEIRRHGFQDDTKLSKIISKGVLDTSRDGEKGVFSHVAFVTVTGMPRYRPEVPIALVDDQPVVIGINANRDNNTLFTVLRAAWQSDVSLSYTVQNNLFKSLEALAAKPEQREEVIKMAERGQKRSRVDYERLMKEKRDLSDQAKGSGIKWDTRAEDRQLQALKDGEAVLEQFITAQKEIEAKENDPKRKQWRAEVARAKLLEEDLEFDEAIAIYKKIKSEGFEDAGLDRHLETLEKLWKIASDAHKEARHFIYKVWPTLDSPGLEENLPKAREALATCKKAGDVITIRKMLKGTQAHAERLAKELDQLRPEVNIDDEEPAKKLKKVSAEIVKLGKEINQYLDTQSANK